MTLLECGIIFGGIPAGAISRKGGLIWGIPAKYYNGGLSYKITRARILKLATNECESLMLNGPYLEKKTQACFLITRRCNTSGARRYTGHVTASGPTPTRTFTLWSLTREATGARWLSSPAGRRLNCCFSRNSFAILVTRQATSQSWGCSSTGRALQWH